MGEVVGWAQFTQESMLAHLKFLAEQRGAKFSIGVDIIKNAPPNFPPDNRKERWGLVYLKVRDRDPNIACNLANEIVLQFRDDTNNAYGLKIRYARARYVAAHPGYIEICGNYTPPVRIWEKADPSNKSEPLLKQIGNKLQSWLVALQDCYK